MGYGDHMMGYYGLWGGLMWLIIIVLVGLAVYFIIVHNRQSGLAGRGSDETALDILKKRYARGEITKEEFDQLKKDIES
jgi:putative membrane protein